MSPEWAEQDKLGEMLQKETGEWHREKLETIAIDCSKLSAKVSDLLCKYNPLL